MAAEKVARTVVHALVEALAEKTVESQCMGLGAKLVAIPKARRAAAAEAGRAATKKGSAIARGFLAALAKGSSSDELVAYCSHRPRGRGPMWRAFQLVWRQSEHAEALEAAYNWFGELYIDDPVLLEIGVEAARRCGNTNAVAERQAKLDLATRLAPSIAKLATKASTLDKLSTEERAHVYARILAAPLEFDEALVVAALDAWTDDPRIPALALGRCAHLVRSHGLEEVVAKWQRRATAGDAALIARLIASFDAVTTYATESDQLAPFIAALWPVSSRAEVFALAQAAIASDCAAARDVVFSSWLADAERAAMFDSCQIETLVRAAIGFARSHDDEQDAAVRAIERNRHRGAVRALIELAEDEALRDSAYSGLQDIDSPEVTAFFIERLYAVRDGYWQLFCALRHRFDHEQTIAALRAKPDAHAACAYCDFLYDHVKSTRLVLALGRALAAWPPPQAKDDQRRMRHVFEHASVAALAINDVDAARELVAKANELAVKPFSDYYENDREYETTQWFADPKIEKQLARLASGALDKAIASVRAKAVAARASGKPRALTNAQLGALAGCKVVDRYFEDHEREAVWFIDEAGQLVAYDGFEIVSFATLGIRLAIQGEPRPNTSIVEHALFANERFDRVYEVILIGDRVLVVHGDSINFWRRVPVRGREFALADVSAARALFDRFIVNPPAEVEWIDPWRIAKRGHIERDYAIANHSFRLGVNAGVIEGYADDELPPLPATYSDALAAVQDYERARFAEGASVTYIALDEPAFEPKQKKKKIRTRAKKV